MTKTTIKPLQGRVAVIGGGIFGIQAAFKLADMGCRVTIYERERDILMGASYINQNRMHMGYHYPRSISTARASMQFQQAFCNEYPGCIFGNFDHYYAIAKGGNVSADFYEGFCKIIGLPIGKEWPQAFSLNSDKIEACYRVPERIYDANALRELMRAKVCNQHNIGFEVPVEVKEIKRVDGGWEIFGNQYDCVVNATYGNINKILVAAGFVGEKYQYELCEVQIMSVPWKRRAGVGIMDGAYFGVLPFGHSDKYMLWDVENSVLERVDGYFPAFMGCEDEYKSRGNAGMRFLHNMEKAVEYIPELFGSGYVDSFYITKITPANRDADDARPTEILNHGNGFYSIFAGKICASIPAADQIAQEVRCYLS